MWTWYQSTGEMLYPEAHRPLTAQGAPIEVFFRGYSGFQNGKNNPDLEGVISVGPIPRGVYTIGAPEYVKPPYGPHGPYVLRLTPDAATRAYITSLHRGPDDFLEHGDSIATPGFGSHGCLIPLFAPTLQLAGRMLREKHWAFCEEWDDFALQVEARPPAVT